MIRSVTIRHFKRFEDVTFDLNGHIVLAGPNNCGKTTMLQAVAAFSLALHEWKTLNDFQRHGGSYTKKPIGRRDFSAVPLRSYDLLWGNCEYRDPIEVLIVLQNGQRLSMEFQRDSTEQIYVRPKNDRDPADIKAFSLETTFVPPMTGLETEEPVYRQPKIDELLGRCKPGDVLRNLLVIAHESDAWPKLVACIQRLFHYTLLPPNSFGANILAEYQSSVEGPRLDIASAGSGFQQVLMLLAFLYTRPASVLLLDEPDAHLHMLLQDAIYGELRSVAAEYNSQLIVATHSEVIINSVAPEELCMLMNAPRTLASTRDRDRLVGALRVLTNMDLMLAEEAKGVIFTEDATDKNILVEWARVLNHPLATTLEKDILWKKAVSQQRDRAAGIQSNDYYDKLKLVCETLPGIELLDRDGNPNLPETKITGSGLQRVRWKRYEIESYLFHPAALERFVASIVGPSMAPEVLQKHLPQIFKHFQPNPLAAQHIAALREHLANNYQPAFLQNPLADAGFLLGAKARKDLLPPALEAAGLPGIPYTRYHEIAALMLPEEIHPEVKEKLDAIQRAFNL